MDKADIPQAVKDNGKKKKRAKRDINFDEYVSILGYAYYPIVLLLIYLAFVT